MDNRILWVVIIILFGWIVFSQYRDGSSSFGSYSTTSFEEITNNPQMFENEPVTLNGLFYTIVNGVVYNKNGTFAVVADYVIIDSQGLMIMISAPDRQLNRYIGETLTVQGIIRIGQDCSFFPRNCEKTIPYLELTMIA